MKKGLIFDLYDTLIFLRKKNYPFSKVMDFFGINSHQRLIWRETLLTSSFSQLSDFLRIQGLSDPPDIPIFETALTEEINSAEIFEEVYSVLDELKENYLLVLASNLATPYKAPYFYLELDYYFHATYFSCDIGLKKPDKAFFELIIKEIGLPKSDLIMIGNSFTSDVNGAQNAGIDAILVNRLQKSYPPVIEVKNLSTISLAISNLEKKKEK